MARLSASRSYWDVTRLDIDLEDKVPRKWLAALQARGAHAGEVLDARPDVEDLAEVEEWIAWHELPPMPAPPDGWRRAPRAARSTEKAQAANKPKYNGRPLAKRCEVARAHRSQRQPAALASGLDKLQAAWLLLEGGAPPPLAARLVGVDTPEDLAALSAWHNVELASPAALASDEEVARVAPLSLHQVEVLGRHGAEIRAWIDELPAHVELARAASGAGERERPIIARYHGWGHEVRQRRWRTTAAMCALANCGASADEIGAWLLQDAASVATLLAIWGIKGRSNLYITRRLWRYASALEAAPWLTYTSLCAVLGLQIKSVGEAVRTSGAALNAAHKAQIVARPWQAKQYNVGVIA